MFNHLESQLIVAARNEELASRAREAQQRAELRWTAQPGARARLAAIALAVLALFAAQPVPARAEAFVPTVCVPHIVRRGENLFRIGLRYGAPWPAIARANQLRGTRIYVGQKLCIPREVTKLSWYWPRQMPVGARLSTMPMSVEPSGYAYKLEWPGDPDRFAFVNASMTLRHLEGLPSAPVRVRGVAGRAVTLRGERYIAWREKEVSYMVNGSLSFAELVALADGLEARSRADWPGYSPR